MWKTNLNEVHASLLLDNQQLCLRYIYSREDLSEFNLNETQIQKITNEIPFNLPYQTFVIDNLSDDQMIMLVNLPNLVTVLSQYIKNQTGNVSDEVIDLIFDRTNRY